MISFAATSLILLMAIHNCSNESNKNDDVYTKELEWDYKIVDDEVRWNNSRISGADAMSFVVISRSYSKDKNGVYFYTKIIEGADPASFQLIDRGYARDKNRVYFKEDEIVSADLATFKTIPNSHYPISKDKDTVFTSENEQKQVDVSSFNILGDEYSIYSKDKNSIYILIEEKGEYCCLEILDSADRDTFELITRHYARDKINVYYRGRVLDIEGVDSMSFELVGNREEDYARDKNFVYYTSSGGYRKIVGADPQTFKMLSCSLNEDPSLNTSAPLRLDAPDPPRICYHSDKDNIYLRGEIYQPAK